MDVLVHTLPNRGRVLSLDNDSSIKVHRHDAFMLMDLSELKSFLL